MLVEGVLALMALTSVAYMSREGYMETLTAQGAVSAFAGGLAFGYLKTGSFLHAARYANAMGAQRCTGTEIAIFKSLAETDSQIAESYPS